MKNFLENLGLFIICLGIMGMFYVLLHFAPLWDQWVIDTRNNI
jgi:hypothetical protein|tara:strand:- start:334 stop:462 length:129 start_codon:yes stop_codon:yes gene_type:complete